MMNLRKIEKIAAKLEEELLENMFIPLVKE